LSIARDFIAKALMHDAVADEVARLLYDYLRRSDRDPDVLARPLRLILVEMVNEIATRATGRRCARSWSRTRGLAEQRRSDR